MKVSGFTFLRNGTLLGYPYIQSIKSLLEVCDEVIVALGNSDDDTLERIKDLQKIAFKKLTIIPTTWNENMQDRGYAYAQQKMIAQFNCSGDWAFYLEGDEVIHEKDYVHIRNSMQKHLDNPKVEALVFDYYHFYGSPNTIAYSPRWYKKAPRIIRNTVRSFAPDGLFWLIMDKNKRGRYPQAANIGCHLYHYGHVRSISKMATKHARVAHYWGKELPPFITYGNIDPNTILQFLESHPQVMQEWLQTEAEQVFSINPKYTLSARDKKHRLMMKLEKLFGIDLSKKHFKLVN